MKAHIETGKSLFITGTDTGIGKTTITAALIVALQQRGVSVGGLKPIETGIDPQQRERSDTERLRSLVDPPPLSEAVCLYSFPQPLAPLACAREQGTTIDVSRIVSHVHTMTQSYSRVIVEGAGGAMTPLTASQSMRDLMLALEFPCLLVGHTRLGGINHTLLTLEALQRMGLHVLGIVLNQSTSFETTKTLRHQQESTMNLIQECSEVPVFGPLSFQMQIETNWREGIDIVAAHSEMQRLTTSLLEMKP